MACDLNWLTRYIDDHGPWLYHRLADPAHLDAVLSEGLRPWNDHGLDTDCPDPPLVPRPGHSYLADPDRMLDTVCYTPACGPAIRVDLRALDPDAINPDEDAFWTGASTGTFLPALDASDYGLPDPAAVVADPHRWLSREHLPASTSYTAAHPTVGQWAEDLALGADSAVTHASLVEYGAIAIRGGVPAHALVAVEFNAVLATAS